MKQVMFLMMCLLATSVAQAATIWTGPEISFSKPANADFTDPAFQDALTSNVTLTRGNTAGLFNIMKEESFDQGSFNSPVGTEWATDLNNTDGANIDAANFSNLTFNIWAAAYGGSNALRDSIVGRAAVLHVIADDIYLNIRFTAWGSGGGNGGSFAYMRSTAPAINTDSADFDEDEDIDGADFLRWQRGFGTDAGNGNIALLGDGNANADQFVDATDLGVWENQFGAVSLASAQAVPEPASLALAVVVFVAGVLRRCVR